MTTRLRTPIVHALRRPQSLLGLPHPVDADLPLLLVVPAYLLQQRDRSVRYHNVGDTVAVCTASLPVSSCLFRSALMVIDGHIFGAEHVCGSHHSAKLKRSPI